MANDAHKAELKERIAEVGALGARGGRWEALHPTAPSPSGRPPCPRARPNTYARRVTPSLDPHPQEK